MKLRYRSPPLSDPATARWKSHSVTPSKQPAWSLAKGRQLRNVISTHNAASFLNTSMQFNSSGGGDLSCREEETLEVSNQLSLLRKKHDQSAEFTVVNQKTLHALKFELEHLNQIENQGNEGINAMHERIINTEARITEVKARQEEAVLVTQAYEHMLERMKQTAIHFEIKSQDLQRSLQIKRQILKEELTRQRKGRQGKSQAKGALDIIKKTVDRDRQDREDHIEAMEEDKKIKEENATKREERKKRQMEITEKAADDDRDAEEKRIRKSLRLHRFWGRFLQCRLQNEMQKSTAVEEAFQKIKLSTGFNEIHDVVERYLTREQTYSQLALSVKQSEQLLATKRDKIAELETNIAKLKAVYYDDDLERQRQTLDTLSKENEIWEVKLDKARSVFGKVIRWVARMHNRLTASENGTEVSYLSPFATQDETPSLLTLFMELKDLSHKLIVFVSDNVSR